MWTWLSMPPGSASLPVASMTSAAEESRPSESATMRPPLTAMSQRTVSAAVTTVPPLMTRSCSLMTILQDPGEKCGSGQ